MATHRYRPDKARAGMRDLTLSTPVLGLDLKLHLARLQLSLLAIRLEKQRATVRPRDDAALFAALRRAQAVHGGYLPAHVYDQLRISRPDLELPGSGTIRKWLGSWQEALRRAGLETLAR